jgi:hypothetical protein
MWRMRRHSNRSIFGPVRRKKNGAHEQTSRRAGNVNPSSNLGSERLAPALVNHFQWPGGGATAGGGGAVGTACPGGQQGGGGALATTGDAQLRCGQQAHPACQRTLKDARHTQTRRKFIRSPSIKNCRGYRQSGRESTAPVYGRTGHPMNQRISTVPGGFG